MRYRSAPDPAPRRSFSSLARPPAALCATPEDVHDLRAPRVVLALALGATLALAACGDDDASTPPVVEQPEALALEVPASVTEGEDFMVSVTVFGEDRSRPLTDFSGTVQISVSSGAIEPVTVPVSDGVGSTTARVTGSTGEVTVQATLSALSASSVLDVIPAFVTLEGDPNDPVEGAIPERTFVSDPADYSPDHPELAGVMASYRVVFVVFEVGTTLGEANRLLAPLRPAVAGGVPGIVGTEPGILVLRLETATHEEMIAALEALREDPSVRYAVEDVLLEIPDPDLEPATGPSPVVSKEDGAAAGWTWDATPSGGNWGLELIRVPEMWNLHDAVVKGAFGNPGWELPHTGILDGGFQAHPDLTNLVTIPAGNFSQKGLDHGVHVAGTIGATLNNGIGVDGVNPFTYMHGYWYKAGPSWWESYENLLEAHPDLDIVNLSLGHNWYDKKDAQGNPAPINPNTNRYAQTQVWLQGQVFALRQQLRTLRGKNVPFVLAAAGNDSGNPLGDIEAKWSSPFNYAALELGLANILVVESVANSAGGGAGATRSSFSNVNGHISAPGSAILSTYASQPYDAISGTSMATPHVTGLAGFLLAVNPDLTHAQLRELLTGNTTAVDGGASPRVDAFASVMDIDRITGGTEVLRMLVDFDDGTEDGNRRTDPDANGADYTETDADGDGGPGDGDVDMSDFRRWRDAFLTIDDPDDLDLDGSPTHPKKDVNGNEKTPADGDDESIRPFADLNGDGKVDLESTAFVPGRFGREVTDLDVLKELFDDPHYTTADLVGLARSADIAVRPARLLEADGVVEIRSSIRPKGAPEPEGGVRYNRIHTGEEADGEGLWQVYTVPVDEDGYTVRVMALDAAGDTLHDLEEDFEAASGQDSFWDPAAVEVTVSPEVASLEVGQSQSFTATVTGAEDTSVTWSAGGGNITQNGLYTALAEGVHEVRATSKADPNAWAEAIVEVVQPQIEGEFRGTWVDVSTCIDPGDGTHPITVWLYEHVPATNAIRAAVRYSHGGSIGSASDYFEGTIVNGQLLAYGEDAPEDYEIRATLSGNSLTGRVYEHCSDGTSDIWEFTTTRVN